MASHVVGVAGVDNGEDDEGSQHRRVCQNGAQRGAVAQAIAQDPQILLDARTHSHQRRVNEVDVRSNGYQPTMSIFSDAFQHPSSVSNERDDGAEQRYCTSLEVNEPLRRLPDGRRGGLPVVTQAEVHEGGAEQQSKDVLCCDYNLASCHAQQPVGRSRQPMSNVQPSTRNSVLPETNRGFTAKMPGHFVNQGDLVKDRYVTYYVDEEISFNRGSAAPLRGHQGDAEAEPSD